MLASRLPSTFNNRWEFLISTAICRPFRVFNPLMKDADEDTKTRGMNIKKWFMWYTTCPKCAKKYGKNYVVVIGEIV